MNNKVNGTEVRIIGTTDEITDPTMAKVAEGIQDHFAEKANYVQKIVQRFKDVESILDYYDGLTFYDTELQPLGGVIAQLNDKTVEALYRFQQEMHFCSKLLTIQKYYSQRGDFYKQKFIDTYTNPSLERDELGITKSGIMWMELEEFNLFRAAFDEIFTLE